MLHDMVATHSIVRVSVCRANDGLFGFFNLLTDDFYRVALEYTSVTVLS